MLDYCFQRIDQKAISIDALVDQPTDGTTGQQDQLSTHHSRWFVSIEAA